MPHSSPYSKRFTESLLRNSFKGIDPKNNQLFRYNTKMYLTYLTLLQKKQQVTYYLFTVVPFAVVFILFVIPYGYILCYGGAMKSIVRDTSK